MPYYLQFDGGVQHVDITPINIGSAGDYVEVDAEFHADAGYQVLGAVSGNNILEWSSSTQINVRFQENTFNNTVNVARPGLGQRFKLRFERGVSLWDVYLDDLLVASIDKPLLTFNPSIIGGVIDGGFCSAIRIYSVTVFKGGAVAWDYDPSLSGGTGNLLPDSVAGDDGVLDNFPVDNSQWVFYSEGAGVTVQPTTATTETTAPSPVLSSGASLSATAASTESSSPAPNISAGASVFTTTAITYSFSPDPVISSGASVSPDNAATVTLSPDPSVTATDPVIITPTVATTYSLSLDPGVISGASLSPTAAETTTLSYDPIVGVAVAVNPTTAVTESDSLPPVISSGASVSVDFATTLTEAYNPTIGTYGVVNPTVAYTASESLSPEVIAGVEEFVRSVQIDGLLITNQTLSGTISKDVTISGININSVTLG